MDWIHPDAGDHNAIIEIAHACPSGAITYECPERPEGPPAVNILTVREAGPYAVHADLGSAHYRATFCRCGASKNMPFCDLSHKKIGFTATGEPATRQTKGLSARNGFLRITAQPKGPLITRGNLEIVSGTGRLIAHATEAHLCRCGASEMKPFCDGSHERIGFKA
jgi:CDGSH-type Zn-finger protein